MSRLLIALMLLAASHASLLITQSPALAANELALYPSTGAVGTFVDVSLSGDFNTVPCGDDMSVDCFAGWSLYWETPHGHLDHLTSDVTFDIVVSVGEPWFDAFWEIDAVFFVPDHPAGSYRVILTHESLGEVASSQFHVTSDAPSTVRSVALNPVSGPVGTQVIATGNNWMPGTQVKIDWESPFEYLGIASVQNDGTFTFTFFVSNSRSIGLHHVIFTAQNMFIPAEFTVTASPSTPNPPPTHPKRHDALYIALGDSIASGHGLNADMTECRRSNRAYPYHVHRWLEQEVYGAQNVLFRHLACSGATASEPYNAADPHKWLANQGAEAMQLISEWNADGELRPVLVTITIGANDLGWLDPASWLAIADPLELEFENYLNGRTSQVRDGLRSVLQSLHLAPNVQVVVTEVHNPVNPKSVLWTIPQVELLAQSSTIIGRWARVMAELNATLSEVVWEFQNPKRVRTTVGLYQEFNRHFAALPCGLSSPKGETWIQHPTGWRHSWDTSDWPSNLVDVAYGGNDCVHPNDAGARAYSDFIKTAVIRQLPPAQSGFEHDDETLAQAVSVIESTQFRTDLAVDAGQSNRTWMWGPAPITAPTIERYEIANGQSHELAQQDISQSWRLVQYYDKSRMEVLDPGGDSSSPWYVTNGLLVMELVTGRLQLGDDVFEQFHSATVNVAGDADDPTGPTYATFNGLLRAPALPDGSVIIQRVNRQGNVTNDAGLASRGVNVSYYDDITKHSIAAPFWEFMNSSGLVWKDGAYVHDKLFPNPFYATGRPITEPYWANVKVAGTYKDVLMQCFERRCLTYTPDNPEGWQVEAGNVGQHYYTWRYEEIPSVAPSPEVPTEPEKPSVPSSQVVDLGNPESEAAYSLTGWGSIVNALDSGIVSPSGDSTKRYQNIRSDNSVTFTDITPALDYRIITEVEDGGCTDNFDIVVNGTVLLSYESTVSKETTVYAHTVLVPGNLIQSSSLTVVFRNTSIDDCGGAAVYNLTLEPVL